MQNSLKESIANILEEQGNPNSNGISIFQLKHLYKNRQPRKCNNKFLCDEDVG